MYGFREGNYKRMKKTIFMLPAIFLCLRAAFAADPDISVTPSGSVYYQAGQLVNTTLTSQDAWPDKTWDQRAVLKAQLNAEIRKHVQINVGIEFGMLILVQPPVTGAAQGTTSMTNIVDPLIAQGAYSFGDDSQNSPLKIALGYFPFKYDASANNMGEYLFRSGAYPPFIINTFDDCQARLLGLHVSSSPIENLNLDMLFTNETFFKPWGDYSLSFVAGYKLKNVLDFGAGISFKDLLSVDPALRTPKTSKNIIYDDNGNVVTNGADTSYYTFQGTKLMARASFDFKGLLNSSALFGLPMGANDWKVYFESAILGTTNYPRYFENLSDRWPVMIGFDVPTFTIFDVLSLELEYCHVKYDHYSFNGTNPVDGFNADSLAGEAGFRWSIFLNKTFGNGIGISGIVGKDHFRPTFAISPWPGIDNPLSQGTYGSELLMENSDWHYALRMTYSF